VPTLVIHRVGDPAINVELGRYLAANIPGAKYVELPGTDHVPFYDGTVRQQLARFRGQEVKNLGDGFLATFDGPARAVRCAASICESMRPLGIAIRSGLHTGEVEMKRDDVAGIAVHIAARVAAEAEGGETVVSSTVRDLVAGSGLNFQDRGIHELKGLPEALHLYSVLQVR